MTPTGGTCPVCEGPTSFLLRFCDDCRSCGADVRWLRDNPPHRPEHAPGHPIGATVGPGGAWAKFCTVEDCDWRVAS